VVNGVINYSFDSVKQRKSGKLWFIKHKVVFAQSDLPNIDRSRVFGQL